MRRFNLTVGYMAFSAIHVILFALSLAVCGLYGTDVQRGNEEDVHVNSKWVYAVVVGSLSAVTCVVYFIPIVFHAIGIAAPIWNFILFILWITLFGVFGKLFIKEDPEGDGGIKRMKNAVWVDLVGALLWLATFVASLGYWWKHRDVRTRFTGRAHV
ncbi:hypothetical protein K4F52_006538 [Lecanicillium sp. MT-2017a]|nr:hypothetical protein K4F52_006538 [Lecanicillium sp. MT-2017a]